MTINYTSLLGLAQPVTGTESGTWGTVVNDQVTDLIEDAIAATATASVTSGDWTLSTTGSGAVNEARCAIIRPTGTPGTTRNVIAPAQSKAYIVDNQSNGAIVFKASATTGVTIAAGKQALVAWNGSDFVQVGASAGGSNTQVQYNDNGALGGSANLTFNGTVLTSTGFSGPLNGTVGASTPAAVTGTTITANTGFSGPLNGTVGATTPNTGVFTQVDITAQGDLRLQDTSGGQYVALQAPGTVGSSYTLTLPSATGTSGQVIQTDGSGNLSFATISSPAKASGALIVNTTTVSENYTVPTGSNAFSVGPITVASGYAVTVSAGQRWVVI